MKWSWKIFNAFGIGVYVHVTFLLLLAYLLFSESSARNFTSGLVVTLFIIAVFGCVLLHELGHALMARRFGIQTRDITLLPIGGLARLEKIPSEPRQELAITLAGPSVNLVLAGILFTIGSLAGWDPAADLLRGDAFSGEGFIWELVRINWLLALFNFIPAFPMDGGRILRALLALKIDYLKATGIAVTVGQILAFAFGLYGLMYHQIFLALIAFFVYLGAAQEGALVQFRHSFQGLPTSLAMMTDFQSLQESDRLERAVELLLQGSQVDFPVMHEDQVVGILTRNTLIESLGSKGPLVNIASLPLKQVELIDADLPLDLTFEMLQSQGVTCLPVTKRGRLVGLISLENLTEFSLIQTAYRRMAQQAGGA